MLKFDAHGILVDTQAGDGGDSANRAGLWALLGHAQPLDLFEQKGFLVRHPFQEPWNHPGNFTRDQLLPYVAGLWRQGEIKAARRVFWRHLRRGFFAQNLDRDQPGTRKKPWPHRYRDDRDERAFSWFDFADPLMPDHIFHLILCARLWPFYIFGIFGYPWLLINIFGHGLFSRSDDEGQILSQCLRAGRPFVAFYRFVKPDYRESLRRYWDERRRMGEIADALIEQVEVNPRLQTLD